jgi:hypothetical protein
MRTCSSACSNAACRSPTCASTPDLFARGLILDLQLGNIVKANRFGYVTQAAHGTRPAAARRAAQGLQPGLGRPQREALGVPQHAVLAVEACLYGQLVDLLDRASCRAISTTGRSTTLVGAPWTRPTSKAS